jgi:hypothetical protein
MFEKIDVSPNEGEKRLSQEEEIVKHEANQEDEKREYEFLKNGLLDGSLSLEKVRNKLVELDQATPTRDAADKNLQFLKDPQIVEYINQHPEMTEGYNRFLSFTEFHVAQRLTLDNPIEAINHFKMALENARVTQSDGESWASYIQGTLLYMEGKEIPEELIAKAEQSKNAQILKNFNKGLKARGFPSYLEDYSK